MLMVMKRKLETNTYIRETRFEKKPWGSPGGSVVEHLPSAQGVFLGSQDRVCLLYTSDAADDVSWV